MEIRTAALQDLDAVAAVEAACFPAVEAATKEEFAERLRYYGSHFWLMFDGGNLIGFVDGMARAHNEQGCWQMIFGVNTLPAYRRQGVAAALIRRAIADARAQGRKGLVLTCKDQLVHYYAKFGFVSEGVSVSTHGGVVWFQMRLTF